MKDDQTISFKLKAPNVAFLEYMTIGILPKHLLDGKNMQEDEYFKAPVGTGPYKFVSWDEGQSIVLKRNEEYWNGKPNIEEIIFKIVPDDNAKALQIESGEVNFSQLTPKDAKKYEGKDGFEVYHMKTSDYRGIMYNFNNPFWKENKELIHAINCAVDRDAMVKSVILGEGIPAYGPLARNEFNDKNVKQESYDPEKAQKIIEENGFENCKVACLSTEYHVPRIKFLCEKAGLGAQYYYYADSPNFFGLWSGLVREYMSYGKLLLTGHL